MKDYALILEAYTQVEKYYINAIDNAVANNDDLGYLKGLELSRINEYAYFILFWGQFESFINDKAFEIEGVESEHLGLMLRLGLIISPTHEFYAEVSKYYDWRCKLAHGEIQKFPELTLPVIFDKIEEIIEATSNSTLPLGEVFPDFFNNADNALFSKRG